MTDEAFRGTVLALAQTRINVVEFDEPSFSDFAAVRQFLNDGSKYHTTRRDWLHNDLVQFFEADGRAFAIYAKDNFCLHGLVGAILTIGMTIEYVSFSARILGSDIDVASFAAVLPIMRGYLQDPVFIVASSGTSRFYHDLFDRCGFLTEDKLIWQHLSPQHIEFPSHITSI